MLYYFIPQPKADLNRKDAINSLREIRRKLLQKEIKENIEKTKISYK
jgi:hypothetical protein